MGLSTFGVSLPVELTQLFAYICATRRLDLRTHHRHAVYDRALATADELLVMCKSHFGSLHPATASAYNNVGLMHKLLGNYEKSRAAYHESLRLYGEVCGKDHASYAAALSNLGMLERGHVIESEANDGNDGEETEDGAAKEEGVDLGQLRDENVGEFPKKMSALERMQLNESAIEYLDEAYRIRISELGENHPHSITSRSQLGSALASAVIAERKQQLHGLIERELRILKDRRNVSNAREMEDHVPEAIAKAAAKSSSSPNRLSKRRYEAAEDHLRGALNTAVDNPRGECVTPLAYLPSGTSKASSGAGITLPNLPKKDRSLSKKERKKLEKERRREKRKKAPERQHATSQMSPVKGIAARVSTLSAATAAQNLAVFKKYHCDWIRLTLGDSTQDMDKQAQDTGRLTEAMEESRNLYEAALHVRSSILPAHHPEVSSTCCRQGTAWTNALLQVIATKFSLAELLDSPRGPDVDAGKFDEKRANVLREEILEFLQEKDEKS